MDQWTIDCLQKYVRVEVFSESLNQNRCCIELDGTAENLESEAKMIENWLSENAIGFRRANSDEEAEELWELEGRFFIDEEIVTTKLNEDVVVPIDRQLNWLNLLLHLGIISTENEFLVIVVT